VGEGLLLFLSSGVISEIYLSDILCFKARSRLELREKCTKEDAEDVIEIMKYR